LKDRGYGSLAFVGDGTKLVASLGESFQLLETATGHMLYERVELEGGEALLRTGAAFVEGGPRALRRVHVLCEGRTYPLESFAALLLDPKRVRAAATGIEVAPARVHIPPEIARVEPASGSGEIADGKIALVPTAEDELGLMGFEVERDGELVDADALREA